MLRRRWAEEAVVEEHGVKAGEGLLRGNVRDIINLAMSH